MIAILNTKNKDLIDLIMIDRIKASQLTLDDLKALNLPTEVISQSIVNAFLFKFSFKLNLQIKNILNIKIISLKKILQKSDV